jgi:molecular chaperone GrpE
MDTKKKEKAAEGREAAEVIKKNAEPAQTAPPAASAEEKAEAPKKEPEKEAKETKKKEEKHSGSSEKQAAQEKKIAELEAQVKDLEGQVAKLKNAYAMAYADTENTRKRLNNEFDQHMKYHIQDFALSILPVVDNCERALALKPEDSADENYRKAFEMVYKQMMAALKKEGVEVIDCKDKEFDPAWMQAVMSEHREGVEPNMVLEVLQNGYKLKDRLLRAAMVKVSA